MHFAYYRIPIVRNLIGQADVHTPAKPLLFGLEFAGKWMSGPLRGPMGHRLDGKIRPDRSVWTVAGGLRVRFGDALT